MIEDNSFDCKKFVPNICKAYCCGNVPIKKNIYYENFFKRNRAVIKEIDLGDEIFPETNDHQCTFLGDNYKCLIYKNRPEQCSDFGCSKKPFMACPYMNTNGTSRTKNEVEKYKEELKKQQDIIEKLYTEVQENSSLNNI